MKKYSAISSGWKGDLNGHIQKTGSHIQVSEITLRLDNETAWALCNLLVPSLLSSCGGRIESEQTIRLLNLGAAIGELIDHYSKDNLKPAEQEGGEKGEQDVPSI